MTTTFIDAPGRLTNTHEPLDFTTDRLVTSISVEYNPSLGNGRRETVFDGTDDVDNTGGDFAYQYRASTKTGSGPYTWSIKRSERWPSEFRLRVKEIPVPVVTAVPQLQPLNYSPVAAWPLDYYYGGGTQQQYVDRSGHGYTLGGGSVSNTGGADIIPGKHSCLHGVNPNNPGASALTDDLNSAGLRIYGDLTIAFRYWVAVNAPATEYPFGLVTGDDVYGAWAFTTSGNTIVFRQNGGGTSSTSMTSGVWHFIVGRRTSGVFKFAVDNVWDTLSTATVGVPTASNSVLRVAGQVGPSRVGLFGGLADVVIWGAALTDAQCTLQYKAAMGV